MIYGSLFSGLGGGDLGFESAGLTCAWQVEINERNRRVLAKYWPNVRRHDDIKTMPLDRNWRVECIIGGDPCQANSGAAGPSASRAESLGGEFLRIVDALRPRIVVRENPSHVKRDAPWPWWRFRTGLESLGYAVLPFRLRACCLGADHQRERLFLLAEDANAGRVGLEGWNRKDASEIKPQPLPPLLGPANWDHIRTMPGLRSRAGLSDYVERVTGLGNAICPHVAEWIGRRIIEVETAKKHKAEAATA